MGKKILKIFCHIGPPSACTRRNFCLGYPKMAKNDPKFEGKNYEIIKVPVGEEVAANSLRVNETLFVPNGFEKTDLLLSQRYDLSFLTVDEVGKVDAGLSCMSLRW